MASNLSEIVDAIENLNATFDEIVIEEILPTAIQTSNDSTGGWMGLVVFGIMCLAVLSHIHLNKSSFQIFDRLGIILISMSIFIDLGYQLLLFGIIASVQVFGFIFTLFFVICTISLLKKDMQSSDT